MQVLTFRFMMHWKVIFDFRNVDVHVFACFVVYACLIFLAQFVEKIMFSHWIIFGSFRKISWLYVCWSILDSYHLFQCSLCPSLDKTQLKSEFFSFIIKSWNQIVRIIYLCSFWSSFGSLDPVPFYKKFRSTSSIL